MVAGALLSRDRVRRDNPVKASELAERYLEIGRHSRADRYCPLAFLVTDIGHSEPKVKATYTHILTKYQAMLASLGLSETNAIKASVMLIGGVALSRAVADEELKNKILDACLEQVKDLEG